jgi:hypothetical protein
MTNPIFLISGMPRISDRACAFWRDLIDRYSADVYVHTWYDNNDSDIQAMVDTLDPIGVQIDNPVEIDTAPYEANNYHGINIYNCFSGWTSVNRVFSLMQSHTDATDRTVLRARFDIEIDNFYMMPCYGLVLPMNVYKEPHCVIHNGQFLVSQQDVIAYGPAELIQRYSNTINIAEQICNHANWPFTSEMMLAASLHLQQVPIYNQTVNYRLIRQ